ncbi:MAG: formylglycine-generating enzyme family protein [Opitutales bacterium]|nr:formylglycine-generating enzyme family protein [Opitutales bacterium]
MSACCHPNQKTPSPSPSGSEAAIHPRETLRKAGATYREGLLKVSGGTFLMGSESSEIWPTDGEAPVREITISDFFLSPTAVTNQEFKEFAEATGYRTEAETFGWSYVFKGLIKPKALAKLKYQVLPEVPWWYGVEGACWRKPEGPGSNLKKRWDHPVTHISWNDAAAYCEWRGQRLPTEAEWEYAARAGLEQKTYPWGDDLTPFGKHRCNIWQGTFPERNSMEDGYFGTCPVRAFKPNAWGFYNISGNVWEWTNNWFSGDFHQKDSTTDPTGPAAGETKVVKGGSYLCHASYCNRYRVSAKTANTPDTSLGHCGFRTAADF